MQSLRDRVVRTIGSTTAGDDPRQDAQSSLLAFSARMFRGYREARHITDQLIPAIERAVATPDSRLIVTMPPRHSKSLHVSEHLPAWYLGNHPDRRVIAASHTANLAYTFSRRVRNKIADPRYPFEGVRIADDKGAVEAWDIHGNSGGYVAVGRGGSPTGHGADLIIIDDPIRNHADADSATVRDALHEWYRETMRTRLEPGGSIIVTATRWHEDDLTGRLLAEMDAGGEQWEHLHLPALDDDGAPLWPERWTVDRLMTIKAAVGTRGWESLYQGRPQPTEGGMFKRHWWRFWQPRGVTLPPVPVKQPDGSTVMIPASEAPAWWDRSAQSWDMTFKTTKAGSYVVCLVGATHGPTGYLLDRYRERTDFPGTINAVQTVTAKYPDVPAKLIEEKANGAAVLDTLGSSISGLIPVQTDGSKEARAHASTARVEAHNWYLPHPVIAPWVTEFIDELAAFPNGTYDDQVDAFSQLDRYLFGAGGSDIHEPTGALADYLAGS